LGIAVSYRINVPIHLVAKTKPDDNSFIGEFSHHPRDLGCAKNKKLSNFNKGREKRDICYCFVELYTASFLR